MYDNESKTGIKVYTVLFLIILTGFIGFLVTKGFEDTDVKISKSKKTSQVRGVK